MDWPPVWASYWLALGRHCIELCFCRAGANNKRELDHSLTADEINTVKRKSLERMLQLELVAHSCHLHPSSGRVLAHVLERE